MKRLIFTVFFFFTILMSRALFADEAQWVSGKIKSINAINQVVVLTPEHSIIEDGVIVVTADENTTYTGADSFSYLKVGQEVEVEFYDDETSPKKMAREIKLVVPPTTDVQAEKKGS